MEEGKPNKLDIIRNPDGTFVKGTVPNPAGRPKGKTMKEFAREFLMQMDEKEKKVWLKNLAPEVVWRMAEGNPAQDLTSGGEKIQQVPIYGGQSVQGHNSDTEDISTKQKN